MPYRVRVDIRSIDSEDITLHITKIRYDKETAERLKESGEWETLAGNSLIEPTVVLDSKDIENLLAVLEGAMSFRQQRNDRKAKRLENVRELSEKIHELFNNGVTNMAEIAGLHIREDDAL